MPYISMKTNKKLTLQQDLDIKKVCGEKIGLLNKTENYLMIHIEDNQVMYFRGKNDDCVMITVQVYGHPSLEEETDFTAELIKEVERVTHVPKDNIYLTFTEFDHWGMFGELV